MIVRSVLVGVVVSMLVARGATASDALLAKAERGPRDLLVVAGGDVAWPAGPYDDALERLGPALLASVAPFFADADIAYANLEAPLTMRPPVAVKRFPFTMPPARLAWLLAAGVDLVSIASNHADDAGEAGVRDMLAVLEEAARGRTLRWTGVSVGPERPDAPLVFVPAGKSLRVALLAFSYEGGPLVATVGDGRPEHAVRRAREVADLVIVALHFGMEYRHEPEPAKVRLFHRVAEAGADLVVGHHPHVLQGIERHAGAVLFYSLGNLSFASKPSARRMRGASMYGLLPLVEVRDGRIGRVELVPLWVDNTAPLVVGDRVLLPTPFRPQVLEGAFAEAALDAVDGWSAALGGRPLGMDRVGGRGVLRVPSH